MNFSLEKWRYDFVPSLAKYANNLKIGDNLRDGFPFPYTEDDARKFIDTCLEKGDKNQLFYAILVDKEAIGCISIQVQDNVYKKSAELGYFIGEPFWGRGITSKAVQQICNEAFECFDIVRIFAEVYEYNIASCKVLENAGFNLEGIKEKSIYKNEKIYNSYIYTLLKT